MKYKKRQKGFTLVEIAVVLVIIGLLLGGVLKGQEMITNAKIKALTSGFEGVSTAYYAYQDRTGRTPGDEDADGLFDGHVNETEKATSGEQTFFSELRTEGFISGAESDGTFPTHGFEDRKSVV